MVETHITETKKNFPLHLHAYIFTLFLNANLRFVNWNTLELIIGLHARKKQKTYL